MRSRRETRSINHNAKLLFLINKSPTFRPSIPGQKLSCTSSQVYHIPYHHGQGPVHILILGTHEFKKPDTTSTKFKHLPRDHSFPSIIWLTILPPKLETINENWTLIQFSTSNKETCGFAQKNQWMHQWELLLLVHQHRYNPITLLKLVTRRSVNTVTWSKCYQTPVVKFGHSTPTQQFVRTKTINPYRLTIKDTGNTILIGSGGFKGLIWNSQEKLENKPKKVE